MNARGRFIALVDEFYRSGHQADRHGRGAAQELYRGDRLAAAFQRTAAAWSKCRPRLPGTAASRAGYPELIAAAGRGKYYAARSMLTISV